jgi:hypothetical protein
VEDQGDYSDIQCIQIFGKRGQKVHWLLQIFNTTSFAVLDSASLVSGYLQQNDHVQSCRSNLFKTLH